MDLENRAMARFFVVNVRCDELYAILPAMSQNLTIGFSGETAAADFLSQQGYKIIATNYRSGRWGELDIIATESGDLVFVEVKTRSGQSFGQPVEAVTYGKLQRLRRAAEHFKLTHANLPDSLRFDVVAVEPADQGWSIQLYRNIES